MIEILVLGLGVLGFMTFNSGSQDAAASRGPLPSGCEAPAAHVEWIGRLGEQEPAPYAAMTPAERIEMVWPLTVTAWAFSGKAWDESRLRRDVESLRAYPRTLSAPHVSILSRRHLIANKRATGRPQDLADVARLEATE